MSVVIDGSNGIDIGAGNLTFPNNTTQTTTGQPTLMTAVTISGSPTSIDFTGIPSWVKRITVMFNGFRTSGTLVPIIQIGDAGGIEATGYLGAGGYVNNASPTAVSTQTTGFAFHAANSSAVIYHGIATLQLLDAATNAWVFNATLGRSDSNVLCFGGGSKSLSATLDRVRITTVSPSTDTFTAGSINVMYE